MSTKEHTMNLHRFTTALAFAGLLAGAATTIATTTFATSAAPAAAQTTDTVSVSVVADTARSVSANIPQGGGSVSVTGRDGTRYTLTIPAKALENTTLVTITPLLRLDGQPFSGGLAAGVDLQPDGLRLYRAASLVVTPGRGVSVKNPISVSYHGSGSSFHLYPLSPTKDLRFGLVHFSGYAISGGTTTEVQTQLQRNAGGPEETLEQQLEPSAAALRTASNKTAGTYVQQLVQTLRDDFNNRVRPLLAVAMSDCQAAKGAVQQALGWERRVSILGLDSSFAAEMQSVDNAVLSSLQRCWDEARRTCLDKNDQPQLLALLAVQRIAMILELDAVDLTRFDVSKVPTCVWRGNITVTATRHDSSDDGIATSSSSLSMNVAMSGQSNGDPTNGTYQLALPGTNDLSTTAEYRQHTVNGDGECAITTDISSTSSTSGSTPGIAQAELRYGSDGTYLLVFGALAGSSTGTITRRYVVDDPCVPADSTDQSSTSDIRYDVTSLGLDGQGSYDMQSDTITGSATDSIVLPGSSTPATLTYTWTLTRGPSS